MNLLVTNTRNAQAYAIIRALRSHADKIVATMEGENRLAARLSHAANSRLVDKRYYTPSPAKDWRAGKIQRDNTETEEAYIQAVLKICEREKIDTIFPSFDPHVYVLSKNKERLQKRGILIPVPDYETVITPLDKYRTIRAAEAVGFPCPKTYLPESKEDLSRIANELGFPLIIKRRFSAAGRGMHLVKDLPELLEKANLSGGSNGTILVQEYIPGRMIYHNFAITLDKMGELKMIFCTRSLRHLGRFWNITVLDSPISQAYAMEAARMTQKLGWWGGVMVQTKPDFRDQTPKLMEINPRIGQNLWQRTEIGINEPLMILKIARGEDVEPIRHYPVGTIFADPVESAVMVGAALVDILIYRFRTGFVGKEPIDRSNPAISLRELIRSLKETYFSSANWASSPYTKYFLQDPKVSLIWWGQFMHHRWIRNGSKDLGR